MHYCGNDEKMWLSNRHCIEGWGYNWHGNNLPAGKYSHGEHMWWMAIWSRSNWLQFATMYPAKLWSSSSCHGKNEWRALFAFMFAFLHTWKKTWPVFAWHCDFEATKKISQRHDYVKHLDRLSHTQHIAQVLASKENVMANNNHLLTDWHGWSVREVFENAAEERHTWVVFTAKKEPAKKTNNNRLVASVWCGAICCSSIAITKKYIREERGPNDCTTLTNSSHVKRNCQWSLCLLK